MSVDWETTLKESVKAQGEHAHEAETEIWTLDRIIEKELFLYVTYTHTCVYVRNKDFL